MAYMLLEEKLRLKNIKLKKLEEDLLITKDKYLKGMNENKEERMNENGVSTTSTISIQVLEAKDLKPMNIDGYCDPYVQLSMNNSKVLTSYKPTTLNPIWNEEFSLMAPNKNLSLKVEIFNKRKFGGDELIGTVLINLKTLEDQIKHDNWYKIQNTSGKQDNGEIRLRLQFIWSKYKYFSDNFGKTENQIKRLHEDFE
jgi:Ca2+-dependent lipid-binding protein